jgi:hypothetical protein
MTNAMLDRGWIVAATDDEGLGAERFANGSAPASYEPLHPAEVLRTSCPSHRA